MVTAIIVGIVIAIVIAAAIAASVIQGRGGSNKRSLREVDLSESILDILLLSHDTVE